MQITRSSNNSFLNMNFFHIFLCIAYLEENIME